jgi:hypothetical protein
MTIRQYTSFRQLQLQPVSCRLTNRFHENVHSDPTRGGLQRARLLLCRVINANEYQSLNIILTTVVDKVEPRGIIDANFR